MIDRRRDDPFVQAVLEERLPYVSLGRVIGARPASRLDHDHHAVCSTVASHLRDERYERIAMLSMREEVSLRTAT